MIAGLVVVLVVAQGVGVGVGVPVTRDTEPNLQPFHGAKTRRIEWKRGASRRLRSNQF